MTTEAVLYHWGAVHCLFALCTLCVLQHPCMGYNTNRKHKPPDEHPTPLLPIPNSSVSSSWTTFSQTSLPAYLGEPVLDQTSLESRVSPRTITEDIQPTTQSTAVPTRTGTTATRKIATKIAYLPKGLVAEARRSKTAGKSQTATERRTPESEHPDPAIHLGSNAVTNTTHTSDTEHLLAGDILTNSSSSDNHPSPKSFSDIHPSSNPLRPRNRNSTPQRTFKWNRIRPLHSTKGKGVNKEGLHKLYIGGLFELSDTPQAASGQSELHSALMAIQHINDQRFIPGYHLDMVFNDTKCDPGYGTDAFYDLVYRKPTMIMLIGSSCSEVTKTLGEIVPYWNLVLVSYAATSPALSKREKYPTFYRLATADSSHNAARKTFIQYFRWNTVATLTQDLETFSLAINEMNTDFEGSNITLKASETFRGIGDDLHAKMKALKETDTRIIIGLFQEGAARQVFCEAYQLGMYGARYVWMLVGWYKEQWWLSGNDTKCTAEQLTRAVDGYFSVDSLNSVIGNKKAVSGLNTEEFLEKYQQSGYSQPRSAYAQVTYDTVWTVALTLKRTMEMWRSQNITNMTLSQFDYIRGLEMKDTFFSTLGQLEFMGVSGPISFDGPDRRGITVLKQNQAGIEERISLFYPENNTLDFKCQGCKPIIWKGGKIPADKYTILIRQERIDSEAFYTVCSASICGLLLAGFFLGFNLHHRKLKYIKLSSPKLNNVAVIGCILVYIAVILLGFDDATVNLTLFPVMCTLRAFLMAAGFSLAFGAMFTKTYRVHQIFTRAHSGLVKSKLLKDKQLLLIIGALLALDSTIIILWVCIDPMQRTIYNFTSVPSEENMDLLYTPQLSRCNSQHLDKWMGAFYAYKGILILFGVYMAWETRNVKIPVLNDSQYIGMNIYNVVMMSITTVVLSSLLSDQITLSYAVVSALIILSTTGMLLLLFLPKIYAILKHNGSPVITSSGLTVEANTRRFAVDDKKELYYRAEVQNRVYKRELVQLDDEVIRLERLLDLPLQPYCQMTDDLMFLLPESKVDSSPLIVRRRRAELARCESITITDADDVCMELPEIAPGSLLESKRKLEKQDSGFHTMSFKNSNFMSAEEEGAKTVNTLGDVCAEEQPLMSPSEGATVVASSLRCGPLRRQGSRDGDLNERQSLLMEDTDEEIPSRDLERSTVLINQGSVGDVGASGSDQGMILDDVEPLGSESVEMKELPSGMRNYGAAAVPSGDKSKRRVTLALGDANEAASFPRKQKHKHISESERTNRVNILQRELKRIQGELQALGELEIEVSYV